MGRPWKSEAASLKTVRVRDLNFTMITLQYKRKSEDPI
jgi:hypothetical protein